MFCSHCGTAVAGDASYCHKCGKPIPTIAPETVAPPAQQPADSLSADETKVLKKAMSAKVPPIKPFAPSKRQIVVSIVAAIFLALIYGFQISAGLDGEYPLGPPIGGSIVLSLLAFRHFWLCLNRRGWVGGLIGVAISLLVFLLSAAISGYVKGQSNYIIDHTPGLAALKKNFPNVAEQVKQDLVSVSKGQSPNQQELAAMIQKRFFTVLPVALKTTSDAAVLQYAYAKTRQFQEIADSNANDCMLLMSGRLAAAPYATQARIMASVSKETAQALQDSVVKILNDADAYRGAPPAPDEKRFNALLEQLDSKLKSAYGTSVYYFGDDSLNKPADERCKAGLLTFKEALNLPEKDRAFMLRTLFAGD